MIANVVLLAEAEGAGVLTLGAAVSAAIVLSVMALPL
jgi:hypothetical protein